MKEIIFIYKKKSIKYCKKSLKANFKDCVIILFIISYYKHMQSKRQITPLVKFFVNKFQNCTKKEWFTPIILENDINIWFLSTWKFLSHEPPVFSNSQFIVFHNNLYKKFDCQSCIKHPWHRILSVKRNLFQHLQKKEVFHWIMRTSASDTILSTWLAFERMTTIIPSAD